MRQNEKRIYSGWELLNAHEVSSSTQIRLKINPIPPIFGTLIVFAVLYGCYLGGEVAALYLQKFTEFLLIPKVLNLPILQDRRLYSTVGYLIFGYIGFAFFWIGFVLSKELIGRQFFSKGIFFLWKRRVFSERMYSDGIADKAGFKSYIRPVCSGSFWVWKEL